MAGIRLADRMARLGTESAFEVLARARAIEDAGGKLIHLEIGEPDFPTANSVSCTAAFSQYAAIAALEGPWEPVEEMVAEFRRRRDVIVAGLNDIPGITCVEPQGAFYAFADITGTGQTSAQLQARLLDSGGVAALSGTAFGSFGEGFLRFSYANSVENIRYALEAIRAQLT
jgi:aspartate/methionine/tyrosine aminotransferase